MRIELPKYWIVLFLVFNIFNIALIYYTSKPLGIKQKHSDRKYDNKYDFFTVCFFF